MENNNEVSNPNKAGSPSTAKGPWGMELKPFSMLMHLSVFAGFIVPFAGLVLPIVMWATNKDEHPDVHLHGLIIFNWMISAFIYYIVSFILMLVLIGFPMLVAVVILSIVFAIMGGIKANEGKFWPYPLSIDFFGVKAKLAKQAAE